MKGEDFWLGIDLLSLGIFAKVSEWDLEVLEQISNDLDSLVGDSDEQRIPSSHAYFLVLCQLELFREPSELYDSLAEFVVLDESMDHG